MRRAQQAIVAVAWLLITRVLFRSALPEIPGGRQMLDEQLAERHERLDDRLDLWIGASSKTTDAPLLAVSGELVRYYSRSLLDRVTLSKVYEDRLAKAREARLPLPCVFGTFEALVYGYVCAAGVYAQFRASAPPERPSSTNGWNAVKML